MLNRFTKNLFNRQTASTEISPASGGVVEQILHEYLEDPDWDDPEGLMMYAQLNPEANPLCLAVDGDRCPSGSTKESLGLNHIKHGNCDCGFIPFKWTTERDEQGNLRPAKRIATGDNGEEIVPFSLTAEEWLRANPKTAAAVLGEEISGSFLGRTASGLPLPPISLKVAADRWAYAREIEEQRG